MKHTIWILVLVLSVLSCSGFTCGGPTLPPSTEGGGFVLDTLYSPTPGVPPLPVGGINVQGNWQNDATGAAGDPSQINTTTNILGLADESGKRAYRAV